MASTFVAPSDIGPTPKQGTVVAAARVEGTVVSGDQRGRTLGFPTANIVLPTQGHHIEDGVYAAFVHSPELSGVAAAVSVGRRPTFYTEGERLMEVFVLDYSGNMYGQHITVDLAAFVRPQQRFESLDELRAQLSDDIANVRTRLASAR